MKRNGQAAPKRKPNGKGHPLQKLSAFRPQSKNINLGKPHGLASLDKSIRRDGYSAPMVAAADGEVFAGSKRLERVADIMPNAVPIVVHSDGTRPVIHVRDDIPTADDPRARRLGVADNLISAMDWNPDGALLAALAAEDSAVAELARQENASLKALAAYEAAQPIADAEPQIDRAEELNRKWQVKTGDLWRIGEHRLLCGDCTVRENVERMMGGEKAGAVVTDSPYGINRDGIENDDPEGLRQLFDGALACMPIENAVIINFQSPRLFPVWLDAIRMVGYKFERALWFYDETDVTYPWRGWLMTSQMALVSSIGNPEWASDVNHHDCYIVKTAGKQDDSGGHTTAKPLDVVQDLVAHTTGDVYDPFCGSGTTLVACENLHRRGRGIEISPAYCAVTLERMSTAFPGIEIERIES